MDMAEAADAVGFLMGVYENGDGPLVYPALLKDGTYIGYIQADPFDDVTWEVGYHSGGVATPNKVLEPIRGRNDESVNSTILLNLPSIKRSSNSVLLVIVGLLAQFREFGNIGNSKGIFDYFVFILIAERYKLFHCTVI